MKAVTLIRELINTDNARVVEYLMDPASAGERHLHTRVDEVMYCLSGRLRMEVESEPDVEFGAGESVHIPAGRRHCVYNLDDTVSRFLVVQSNGRFDIIREE